MLSSPVAGVGAGSCMFSYVGLVVSAGADDIEVVPGESVWAFLQVTIHNSSWV